MQQLGMLLVELPLHHGVKSITTGCQMLRFKEKIIRDNNNKVHSLLNNRLTQTKTSEDKFSEI